MIETTISEVDGVTFYKDIKILEPDDTIGGIGVHLIPFQVEDNDPELIKAIRALGLRRIEERPERNGGLYAQYRLPFLWIKLTRLVLHFYWFVIRQLYHNFRFFQEIPAAECFSWRYFTPYVWYKKIMGK